jgi:hypothetical protein
MIEINKVPLVVTYSVIISDNEIVNEANISNKEYADRLANIEDIYGFITLEYQGKKIQIEDELVPWIQNFCLKALSDILSGKKVIVYYFSREGEMTIESDGTSVLIQDKFNSAVLFPFKSLIQELYACGERFIQQLAPIKREDAAFMNDIKSLNFHKRLAEASIDTLQYM